MTPKRFIPFVVLSLGLLIIFAAPSLLRLLIDWFWFQEIGFSNIFVTILRAKILLGLGIGVIGFLIIYFNFWLIKKVTTSSSEVINLSQDGKKVINIGGVANKFKFLISLLLGFITGLFGASNWETVLKYFNSVPFNSVDPIFNRDISFYFFNLPFFQFIIGLSFWIIIVCLISALISYATRGAASLGRSIFRAAGTESSSLIIKQARTHISILVALLFILFGLNIYIVRIPSLLYSSMGSFTGAGYTEINAILPFLKLLGLVALMTAVLTIVNIFKSNNRLVVSAIGTYFLIYILGGVAYPALIQKFIVLPNELTKESSYIEYNIQATRKAFNLDKVVERDLSGETTLTMQDINDNQSTIKNVRLWDREPLLDTFGQLQEIRTYYDFVSIDNDRYNLDGDYRQVLLSPRELNPISLPQRSFINERLTFTHGFGLTLSPVNEVTPEGLPVLFLKDLPPASSIESLAVSRPEIYYGELASNWVVVNTKTQEFDYPSGDENVFTNYKGSGGVKIGSIFRKALFSLKFGSFKVFLSDDITPDSRIMYYRNIEERVKKVLPFLYFDNDPYMVLTKSGELKWIYDAYVASDRYPYAEPMLDVFSAFPGGKLNYIRNSVKIVIDAYDGKMKFYIADQNDPIIQSYSKIFAGAFLPLNEIEDDLMAHIRYPEDLFAYQTQLYTTYHMGEAQIFYNKEDEWQIPYITDKGQTDPMMRHMIMKLPEEEKEEFILMIPFTPRGKDNLSAWMVARNDGDAYGQLMVYRFPKQKLVFGPKQIVNRINQDAEISQEISLWDQKGSEVIRGNLLVIPIEGSLIYIQPIYLRAEGGRIPELKRVIVAYENRIAMEENLNAALARVFGGKVVVDEKIDKTTPAPVTDADLLKQINDHFNRATQAQRQGNWSLYGEEIQKLGDLLNKAR